MKKTLSLLMVFVLFLSTSIVFADESAPPNWDISGTWSLELNDTHKREFRNLVQDEEGKVTGEFWYLSGDTWLEGGTLEGYVSGDKVYLYYERPAQYNYSGDFTGEIDWSGMSGEFKDSSGTEYSWVTTYGESELLWDARVSGGGQMLADSGESAKNGKPIFYKISFGGGSYVSNGDLYFDGLEVTFHNVSNEDVIGGKFIGEELMEMNFGFRTEGVANYTVKGSFNGEYGYKMMIRVQDSGEPNFDADNLRFELSKGETKIYDSWDRYGGDFPGESDDDGPARNSLERGNIQVDDLAGYGIVR